MNLKIITTASLASLLIASIALATPAKQLGDINKVKNLKSIPFNTQSGNKIFFSRTTDAEGAELWVTDGTAAETHIIKDIVPGTEGSQPISFAPVTIGGLPGAYFQARTPANGQELWITDGTSDGTVMVKDIYPGNTSGLGSFGGLPQFLSIPGSTQAFFVADDGTNGEELWYTDGTSIGTVMVDDIKPGSASSEPTNLKYYPGFPYIFFTATNNLTGTEAYVANSSNSAILHDLAPGFASSKPGEFYLMPTSFVFAADDGTTGRELWSTNLSSPTLLADTTPGLMPSYIINFMQLASDKLLYSSLSASAGGIDSKLMITDGTIPGTSAVKSLDCVPGGIFSIITGYAIKTSEVINGHALFPCYNLLTSQSTLWASDGTEASTNILKDFVPTNTNYLGDGYTLLHGNNNLVFPANDGRTGLEPWITDGTTAGTFRLANFNHGEASSIDPTIAYLTIFSPQQNQSASLLPITIGKERKVYYTDGTLANTRELFDDSGSRTEDSYPSEFTATWSKSSFLRHRYF